jgi:TRAP-type C4-dicarboxylate transport system permease small subunit
MTGTTKDGVDTVPIAQQEKITSFPVRAAAKLVNALCGIVLVLMLMHVTADVVLRAAFNRPLPLTLEATTYYYMPAIIFLPLAWAQMDGRHVCVEFAFDRLPVHWQRIVSLVVRWTSAVFLTLLAKESWNVAVEKYATGEFVVGVYSFPVWPSRFFVPIGCGLMALTMVLNVQIGQRSSCERPGENGR